ncbi:hypothetical protein WH96_06340 [Kiloniella spongiae]|uniref:Uncharacterized protein n=1 Tax=Kiloniella spongiae TaxID=1489064 RepID=A0A0H2MI61_9PROT|nr:hypothetical protein [Kiloniella spongiae]KLN61891.1 hypothetical protein WH96_06340 [Kiloniella spongiae]
MGFLENKFNKDITGVNKDSKERPIRGNELYNGRYGTLPLPTTEPVNAEQYYRFLNYNPEDGAGDIGNIFAMVIQGTLSMKLKKLLVSCCQEIKKENPIKDLMMHKMLYGMRWEVIF